MCAYLSSALGEVFADYTCSLYKLRLKFVQTSAEVSRCSHRISYLPSHITNLQTLKLAIFGGHFTFQSSFIHLCKNFRILQGRVRKGHV